MKEAIGTTMVFNLVIIFTVVFITLFVGAISFSKGFKVRNRIIQIIEKNNGWNSNAQREIGEDLANIGYRISNSKKECPIKESASIAVPGVQDENHRYCIYEYKTDKGPYYGVVAFVYVDIPLIGDLIEIPLYGETRVLFMKDRVEG